MFFRFCMTGVVTLIVSEAKICYAETVEKQRNENLKNKKETKRNPKNKKKKKTKRPSNGIGERYEADFAFNNRRDHSLSDQ